MSDTTLIKDVHLHFYSICYICFRTLKYVFPFFKSFFGQNLGIFGVDDLKVGIDLCSLVRKRSWCVLKRTEF